MLKETLCVIPSIISLLEHMTNLTHFNFVRLPMYAGTLHLHTWITDTR